LSRCLSVRARLRLQDYLPYRLSVASNAVSKLLARAYEQRFGLKIPQWRLIAVLADEGPLTPQALCGRTIMDKVTVMRAARGLLQRRLLRRLANRQDARSHRLALTHSGARLYREIVPLALACEARLVHGLAPADVMRLDRLLRRLEHSATTAGLFP
jgi:DNA-binding MarR family transcriptional regulator